MLKYRNKYACLMQGKAVMDRWCRKAWLIPASTSTTFPAECDSQMAIDVCTTSQGGGRNLTSSTPFACRTAGICRNVHTGRLALFFKCGLVSLWHTHLAYWPGITSSWRLISCPSTDLTLTGGRPVASSALIALSSSSSTHATLRAPSSAEEPETPREHNNSSGDQPTPRKTVWRCMVLSFQAGLFRT